MKYCTTATLSLALLLPSAALAQGLGDDKGLGLRVTLSAGLISAPSFLGDDEQQISVVPNITLSYGDRLTASLDGIRYTAFSLGGFKAGVVGAYHFGRDENPNDNPFAIDGGDTTDLIGLGDIDGTVELGGFVEYEAQQFSARLELRQGIDGGHDGLFGEGEIMYNGSFDAFNKYVFFSVGPAIAFGDEAYSSTYFDGGAAQSAACGICQYDAGGGLISYGLHATAIMPLSERTSLVGFINFDQLTGDIGDSSIVQQRGSEDQTTLGLFMNYTF